jgi:hypothetical protein
MPGRVAKPVEIYQIKITLRNSRPPIWRRIQVKSDTTLAKLHKILQVVMGWEDAHMHQFVIRGQRHGVPEPDEDHIVSRKTEDGRKHTLSEFVSGENFRFAYNYDFGDNWEHVLVVEESIPQQEGVRYPLCLDGASACPPEDIGGIPGYEDLLEAIKNPNHPEHAEHLEWVGDDFDPDAFDVDEINGLLRAVGARRH